MTYYCVSILGGVTPVLLNDIGTENEDNIQQSNMISTPLSPLSSLTSALDGLDICSNKVPSILALYGIWYVLYNIFDIWYEREEAMDFK